MTEINITDNSMQNMICEVLKTANVALTDTDIVERVFNLFGKYIEREQVRCSCAHMRDRYDFLASYRIKDKDDKKSKMVWQLTHHDIKFGNMANWNDRKMNTIRKVNTMVADKTKSEQTNVFNVVKRGGRVAITRNGRIISFCGYKGGIGKTKLSIAFGLYLAELGYNVLFVDLDSQGYLTHDLAVFKGAGIKERITHYMTMLFDEIPDDDELIRFTPLSLDGYNVAWLKNLVPFNDVGGSIGKLDIILGVAGSEAAMTKHANSKGSDFYDIFRRNFQVYREDYDFIIIDTPPATDERIPCNMAMSVADFLVMPVDGEEAGIGAMRYITSLQRKVLKDVGRADALEHGFKPIFVMSKCSRTSAKVLNKLYKYDPQLREIVAKQKEINGEDQGNATHAILTEVFDGLMCEHTVKEIPRLKDTIYDNYKTTNNVYHPICRELLDKIVDKNAINVFDDWATKSKVLENMFTKLVTCSR